MEERGQDASEIRHSHIGPSTFPLQVPVCASVVRTADNKLF